jgi:glutathione S-transferase
LVLLYNSQVSGNCYKVRLLLTHLGVPFETHELSVVDRSNRADVIGADANPALRVPTLILDDGRPLAESNAILWYFGRGTRFVPEDIYEQAQMLQWMFFEQYDHEPYVAVARFLRGWAPKTPENEALAESKMAGGNRALDAMERHLTGRTYLVADRLTLADISLYGYTHVAHEGGFELSARSAVRGWLDRVAAEPGHVAIDA